MSKNIQEIFEGRNKKAHRRTVHLGNWGKGMESSIRKGEMASIYWKEYRKVFVWEEEGLWQFGSIHFGFSSSPTQRCLTVRSQRSLVKAVTPDFYPKSQRSSSDRNYQSLPPGCLGRNLSTLSPGWRYDTMDCFIFHSSTAVHSDCSSSKKCKVAHCKCRYKHIVSFNEKDRNSLHLG